MKTKMLYPATMHFSVSFHPLKNCQNTLRIPTPLSNLFCSPAFAQLLPRTLLTFCRSPVGDDGVALRFALHVPGSICSAYRLIWRTSEVVPIKCSLRKSAVEINFSTLIHLFHGFADAGFLEGVLEGVSIEKMRKLITKNRLDQRSRHFRDSVY